MIDPTLPLSSKQLELRDAILRVASAWLEDSTKAKDVNFAVASVCAAAACMGAGAVFLAMHPAEARPTLVDKIADALPDMVEQRAKEIHSGEFDRHMGGH